MLAPCGGRFHWDDAVELEIARSPVSASRRIRMNLTLSKAYA